MTEHSRARTSGPTHDGGPHPGILAAASLGLTVGSLLIGLILAGGQGFPSPFAPAGQVEAYLAENPDAVRFSSLLQFGSAVPLGIFAATVYARQLRMGVRVPGPAISYYGGITASAFLMLSAIFVWVLGRPEVTTDQPLTRALAFLAFLAGGVAYVVVLGLLVAGIAVPALILGFVPRWLAWSGLVIAALCELSFFSLVIEPLAFLLPIGRFSGLLWLVAVGFMLPPSRKAVHGRK